jgi:L,D-peptidoglycan transpeptidase YkuD (ErfK/YbiS/YcfS/YnhG family)
VILFSVLVFLFLPCQHPPVTSLENAKVALNRAAEAAALRYAKDSYRSAEKLMQNGWMEMAHQNGRLAPFRNYRVADSLLNLATQMAHAAERQAQERVRYLDSLAQSQRADLQNELLVCREALDGSLANFKAERYWSLADLSLKTSELLAGKGEYEEAYQTASKGRESLHRLIETLAEYANDEVQKINVWRRWVQEILEESRAKGTYAVIIDKSAHKTYLVQAGNLAHTYNCELGYNSAHQKLFAGDGATPEGKYQVSIAKSNSKYYKALLINYPNAQDKKRFQENKRKGIISSHTRIGGLIEIHGGGGRNEDWTEGCVALTNKEMDHIMQYVTVGTPVTIVRRSDKWP